MFIDLIIEKFIDNFSVDVAIVTLKVLHPCRIDVVLYNLDSVHYFAKLRIWIVRIERCVSHSLDHRTLVP